MTESDPRQGWWTLASRFTVVAAASPAATAVRREAGDLDDDSETLAAMLRGRGDSGGVLLERSPGPVVPMLDILVSAPYGPTENTTFTSSHPVREPLSDRGAPIYGTGTSSSTNSWTRRHTG